MDRKAATILKQTGKALCYYGLFLGIQLIVSVIFIFYVILKSFSRSMSNGIRPSVDQLVQEMMAALGESTGLLILLYSIPLLLFLWLFFLIRHRKLHVETGMLPFRKTVLPYIVLIALGITGFLNTFLNLLPASWLETYGEASSTLTGGPFGIMLLSTGIVAPLVEEIIFRGLILSRLKKAMPFWAAAVISSLLFGLAHGQILWTTYTFFIGLLFCVIVEYTGSILTTILAHAIFNSTSTCLSYTNFRFTPLTFWGMMIVGALFLAAGTYFIIRDAKKESPVLEEEEA